MSDIDPRTQAARRAVAREFHGGVWGRNWGAPGHSTQVETCGACRVAADAVLAAIDALSGVPVHPKEDDG